MNNEGNVLEVTRAHTTYAVTANDKIETRIKACNRSGCSPYSNIIIVDIIPAPPGSRTISNINLGAASSETLDTSQDPQYRKITNDADVVKYYRLRRTGGDGDSTLSIVDGNDDEVVDGVVKQSDEIIFTVNAGETRYIKFMPTTDGTYNHIMFQYSSFPPYEGL